jgi:hypothetical protein
MSKGVVFKRVGTGGVIASTVSGVVCSTSENLTALRLQNWDVVSFTENNGVASSITLVAKDEQSKYSLWAGGNALQRTVNRLKFLGNALL